jgi:hypothetical protein
MTYFPIPKRNGYCRRKYWKSGPDIVDHDKYYAWLKHRSQASYRKESHELTFEDWKVLWSDPVKWHNRGRKIDSFILNRLDVNKSWNLSNCVVRSRSINEKEIWEKRRCLKKTSTPC